jgi:hypothetical protein
MHFLPGQDDLTFLKMSGLKFYFKYRVLNNALKMGAKATKLFSKFAFFLVLEKKREC